MLYLAAVVFALTACNGRPPRGGGGHSNGSSLTSGPPPDALSERITEYARACTNMGRMVATCEVATTAPPDDTAGDFERYNNAVAARREEYLIECLKKTRREITTMWACMKPVTNCAGIRPCIGDAYRGKDSDQVYWPGAE